MYSTSVKIVLLMYWNVSTFCATNTVMYKRAVECLLMLCFVLWIILKSLICNLNRYFKWMCLLWFFIVTFHWCPLKKSVFIMVGLFMLICLSFLQSKHSLGDLLPHLWENWGFWHIVAHISQENESGYLSS